MKQLSKPKDRLGLWAGSALILVALGSAGCASMSKSECDAVDWKTVGYEDGAAGRSGDHIAEHRRACAKYGVKPDLSLYQTGREQGLREYCRSQNGYELGVHGGLYNGICPAELEGAFVEAYEAGRHLYTLESRAAAAANRLDATHRELEHIEHELVEQAGVIVSADSNTEQRAQALLTTQQLNERRERLHADVAELERDKVRSDQDLQAYLAAVPRTR